MFTLPPERPTLRFILGELRATLPDGSAVSADVWEVGDPVHPWRWSAVATEAPEYATRRIGPVSAVSETQAERDALAWICSPEVK